MDLSNHAQGIFVIWWMIRIVSAIGFAYAIWISRNTIYFLITKSNQSLKKWIKEKWEEDALNILYSSGKNPVQAKTWISRQWIAIQIAFTISIVIGFITNQWVWILACLPFILFPCLGIYSNITKRKMKMLRRLPFVFDMLILNLESGLDFISSVEELVPMNPNHPLHQEMKLTLQNIHMGESRSNSFLKMAKRTQLPEIQSLAMAIRQTETMGSSLTELLRLQSQELRHRLLRIAEGHAQKTPVKILAPLLIFIFPVVFILLFVPIGIQMVGMFQ